MTDARPVAMVRVEPAGVTIEVRESESLMHAAERSGYHWPTLCHGQATCTACWICADDQDAFAPPATLEMTGLRLFEGRSFFDGKPLRLACQARPVHDTMVTKRGVKPAGQREGWRP
jgi:2Fe-2S ferredoxin